MELEFVNQYNFLPPLSAILLTALIIFLSCFWFGKLIFKNNPIVPFFIALIKTGFFLIYYLLFLNPDFYSIDSYNYMNTAIRVINKFESNLDFFIELLSFQLMNVYGLGHYIYNAFVSAVLIIFNTELALAPIGVNIVLSVLSAYYFCKSLLLLEMKEKYVSWFFLLFVLHWEVLTWTTITLLKDNFIAFLTIALFYLIIVFLKKRFKWYHLLALIYTVGGLMFSRFYIVPFVGICLIIYNYLRIFSNRKTARTLITLVLTPLFLLISLSLIWEQFGDYFKFLFDFNDNPLYGTIRFFLTPIPFNVSDSRSYLVIPSLINWILIPFTLAGIYRCYGLGGIFRLLILYYFLILFFYGAYSPHGEATGPRHKIQLLFIYILFQMLGLISLLFPKIKLINRR